MGDWYEEANLACIKCGAANTVAVTETGPLCERCEANMFELDPLDEKDLDDWYRKKYARTEE